MIDRTEEYIISILRYCENIRQIHRKHLQNYDEFLVNAEYQMSLCFALEQIGEQAKKLRDSGCQERHPELHLEQIAGLRNRIVHGYDSIDLKMVFDITMYDVPDLEQNLKRVLKEVQE